MEGGRQGGGYPLSLHQSPGALGASISLHMWRCVSSEMRTRSLLASWNATRSHTVRSTGSCERSH